jgi:chromate reductase
MSKLHILGICGSLREKSHNRTLLNYAASTLPAGVTLSIADLSAVPFFNADLTSKPEAVEQLLVEFAKADAFWFACPEYNYSIAPALKNALDWASREPNNQLIAGKAAAIMGAGGGIGTSRAQYHLRQVGVFLDLHFVNKPEVFVNAFAATSFDAEGQLIDARIQQSIAAQCLALVQFANQLKK